MSEVDGVLRTMEFGVSTGLRLAKDTLELMLRFVNFLIARYEKSKEFNMKYEEMNKAQQSATQRLFTGKTNEKNYGKNWRVHGSNCIGKWKRDVRSRNLTS